MDGLRRERIEEGERVNYLLDGLYVICEFSDSGDVLREYVPGVCFVSGGSVYFYHYDRLGSVRFMSDEGGNVVQEYVYDAFGNLVSGSGSVSQPYEYVGREGYYREEELGLYLLGQRWYDSEVGRFISRDPIEKANSYIYGKNNPIQFIDPDGKQAESLVCSTISLPYWMAAPAGAVLIEVVIVGEIIYFIYEICHRFEICPLQSEGGPIVKVYTGFYVGGMGEIVFICVLLG